MIAGVAIALAVGAWVYLTGGRYQTTDDAYLRVPSVQVSTNVPGRVIELGVRENQIVHKGDILFKLEQAPFQIAIDSAKAELADAHTQVQGSLATYQQHVAELQTAQADAAYRESDRAREQKLLDAGAVSRTEYDAAANAATTARLRIGVIRQQIAQSLAALGGSTGAQVQRPAVRTASAAVNRAMLNQSWSIVRAPVDGRVTGVDQMQVGNYVTASTAVFHLVPDRMWIEAAFKENQLTFMRPGQHATIKVDAYPGNDLCAVVESLSPGTDQTFSMLPSENSTGNWVKVVQRLPVRLTFCSKPNIPLQGGLSVQVKVDTEHKRHLFGGGA